MEHMLIRLGQAPILTTGQMGASVRVARILLSSCRPQPEIAEFSVTTSQVLCTVRPEDSEVSKQHLGAQLPLKSTFSQAKGRERGGRYAEAPVLKAGGIQIMGTFRFNHKGTRSSPEAGE